jgi:methyl-accepting chemotaxis protein
VAGKDVLMTTMVAPILVDGKFVGAAGSDLPLADLSRRVGEMQPLPGAHVALLSHGGLYVATPHAEMLAKKATDLPRRPWPPSTRVGPTSSPMPRAGSMCSTP